MATDTTATLLKLADTGAPNFELLRYLDVLLNRSIATLKASSGGVVLTDVKGNLQLLATTDNTVSEMEKFELQRQEGPCIDAHRTGELIIEEDLATTKRWPQFGPLAVRTGYRSAFAFPMQLRGDRVGALNLYRIQAGTVDREMLRTARAFADMATIGILHRQTKHDDQQLAAQLRHALDARIVVEQAKGVIAEHADCEFNEAFQIIRWYARNHNKSVKAVAAAVVAGELRTEELRS